jgi:hypothetical protein
MIPLSMVVHEKFAKRLSQVVLTQHDDPIQTLPFDRPHEPLRVRIGVSRQLHRRRAVRRKPFALPIPFIRSMAGPSS